MKSLADYLPSIPVITDNLIFIKAAGCLLALVLLLILVAKYRAWKKKRDDKSWPPGRDY